MKKVSIVVITLLLISLSSYWYWTTTLSYALSQIKSSIEHRDVTTFKEYVDIETLISRFIDDVLEVSYESIGEENNIAKEFGTGLAQLMKPRMTDFIKERIIRYVENGGTGSHEDDTQITEGLNLNYEGIFNLEFGQPSYIENDGKIAYVGFEFYDSEYDTTLSIKTMFRDLGNRWCLVEIANTKSILETVNRFEEKKD